MWRHHDHEAEAEWEVIRDRQRRKVTIDGNNGTISTGNINMNGINASVITAWITVGSGTARRRYSQYLPGHARREYLTSSRQAATEDQLKIVSDSAIKYDVDSGGTINKTKITLEGSNGTTIGNVAAGEVSATSMDAINGSQLYAVQQDIGNIHRDINKLGDEIDTVGALSAAMAGLHPRFQDGNKRRKLAAKHTRRLRR